jgi:predicted RNA-binding protein YlqC (UPF0109 family)
MSTIDEQFVEYIVKSLVGNPAAVKIDRRVDEKGVLLELTVDPEDLGRIIGKRGATAQSLRTLLRALGTKNEARYNLKIVDNGPQQDRSARQEEPARQTDETSQNDSSITADEPADDAAADKPQAETEETEETGDSEQAAENETADSSDRISRTRRELEDLDDLDI